MPEPPAPTSASAARPHPALLALAAAAVALAWAWWHHARDPRDSTDFDQLWHAARAVRAGLDPYAVIGPRGPWFRWNWPLYYPMPAVLLALPLSWLPLVAARLVFVGASAAALGWAVARRAPNAWPLLLSPAFAVAARAAQWSPLITAAALSPALAWALVAKPSLGAAVAPHVERRALWPALVGGAALLAASFVARPDWVAGWVANVRAAPHFAPLVARGPGLLLLLALLRWRRREARLLLGLAIVPHTTVLYETLPVFLVARTRLEGLLLAVLTGVANVAQMFVTASDTPTLIARQGVVMVCAVHLPALAMVLRRRNEGRVSEWVERMVARWPRWVRGGR